MQQRKAIWATAFGLGIGAALLFGPYSLIFFAGVVVGCGLTAWAGYRFLTEG